MSGYSNMESNSPYKEPAYNSSQWLEQQERKGRKSKWIVRRVFKKFHLSLFIG